MRNAGEERERERVFHGFWKLLNAYIDCGSLSLSRAVDSQGTTSVMSAGEMMREERRSSRGVVCVESQILLTGRR